jgi:hypothetical protein
MKEEHLWGRGKERAESRTMAAHIVLCHRVSNKILGVAGLSCVNIWTVIFPSSTLKLES